MIPSTIAPIAARMISPVIQTSIGKYYVLLSILILLAAILPSPK
jgi:hypothetical protein